jgi:hypothetical protein
MMPGDSAGSDGMHQACAQAPAAVARAGRGNGRAAGVRVGWIWDAAYSVFISKKRGYTPRASAVHGIPAADSVDRLTAADGPARDRGMR